MSGPEVVVAVPAKVNLCLAVGPPRPDGFHPLATVYQALGLVDEVTVRPAYRGRDRVTVSGEGVAVEAVPTDETNIVLRAARLLARHAGVDEAVHVHVHKRIPVAGGMAGGSADGAGALLGCDELWGLSTAKADLLRLAAELGSDVPFALVGGTALGSGRGEVVTPVMSTGRYWWLVVPAAGGLSTPGVYAEFDRLTAGAPVPAPAVPEELLRALRSGDPVELGGHLANDLTRAALALRPDLARVLRRGLAADACGALVSGSGPTTVFLCEGPDHARHVDAALRAEAGTLPGLVAPAPAPGARVVGRRR